MTRRELTLSEGGWQMAASVYLPQQLGNSTDKTHNVVQFFVPANRSIHSCPSSWDRACFAVWLHNTMTTLGCDSAD